MALVSNRNQVGLENTSTIVGVPDNPLARLMYYLHCMCSVLSLNEPGINRLTNYKSYFLLNEEEKVSLLLFCAKLNPITLTGQCLINNEKIRATAGRDNEFYNVNNQSMTFAASESVVVGEKYVTVRKLMVYNSSWLNQYYLEPMQYFLQNVDGNEVHMNSTDQTTGFQLNVPAIDYNTRYTRPLYCRQESETCWCTIL